MDSKRFEKIESKEQALILLAKGEKLYDHNRNEFYYDVKKECVIRHDYCGSPQKTNITINNFLDKLFYLKKPFDVRQAMRENPGEWVGTFTDEKFNAYKVGLDSKCFWAVKAPVVWNGDCNIEFSVVQLTSADELDLCKSIDEVPK